MLVPSVLGWIVDVLSCEWFFTALTIGSIIGIMALHLASRDATEFSAALRLPPLPPTLASSV